MLEGIGGNQRTENEPLKQFGETSRSKLDFKRIQMNEKSHPSLLAPLQATPPKHVTSLLALAIGLPRLVDDSGYAQSVCTGSQVCRQKDRPYKHVIQAE